jgi:N6-adenosine-specific RNA methylase IME4/ParB-like chromosome segregation protein Spo0J
MSDLQFHPLADIFPLMEGEEFEALVSDIAANGLYEPIIVYEDKILDGRNRYRACQVAGVEPTFTAYEGDDPVAYVISLNLRRRHLDESQRAMVAAKLTTLKRGDNQHSPIGETSQAKAAQLLNVGKRSVERAAEVRDHGAPELVEAVERGAVSVSAAVDVASLPEHDQREIVARGEREILQVAKRIRFERGEERRAKRIANLIALSGHNAPLPQDRKYPIVYADPPWQYEHPPFGPSSLCENFYPTMALEDICALPIADLATPDAVLFLWAPAPLLFQAGSVLKAWGATYRTNLVWVKHRPGLGFWARQQHELLLIATFGDPPTPSPRSVPASVIHGPRREHSRKPDEAYALIERMYPSLPKIELFARSAREGWAAWGNQAAVDDGLDIPECLRRAPKAAAS